MLPIVAVQEGQLLQRDAALCSQLGTMRVDVGCDS